MCGVSPAAPLQGARGRQVGADGTQRCCRGESSCRGSAQHGWQHWRRGTCSTSRILATRGGSEEGACHNPAFCHLSHSARKLGEAGNFRSRVVQCARVFTSPTPNRCTWLGGETRKHSPRAKLPANTPCPLQVSCAAPAAPRPDIEGCSLTLQRPSEKPARHASCQPRTGRGRRRPRW